jgi:hypothetical protein
MSDLKAQEKLTDGKGWKFVKNYAKEKKEQLATKAKNIAGGVDVVIKKLKGKD